MIEIAPIPILAKLLHDFDARGGVLEFAFYEAAESIESEATHKSAAVSFLEDCATSYFARTSTIDYEAYPMARLYKYKWDPGALRGTCITFDAFWGTDDVNPKQIDLRAWSIPNVDGYKTAFFHPPHGIEGGVDNNQMLFDEINRHLFGDDPHSLIVWSWSTDCSGYFDAGHEWWGAFLWTISRPTERTITLIAASSTD